MLEGPRRLKPDALLGVLVVKEEPVLVRVAQTLDLGQAVADRGARVQNCRLQEENTTSITSPIFAKIKKDLYLDYTC